MPAVTIVYAGSLARLVEEHLGPAWSKATGIGWAGAAGGSRELARALRSAELRADVFLSADEQVLAHELAGVVRWHLRFATTELGLAYAPDSRFRASLDDAAAGRRPWWEVLRQPGLRFGRPDPDLDPKGYRTLFLFQLAERTTGIHGLSQEVLGADRNPAQIRPAASLFTLLRAGQLDVAPAYRSQSVEEGLPFVALPAKVNLGREELAATYGEARYVSGDGVEYRGAPIRYAAALVGGDVSTWAACFMVFLTQPGTQAACELHGFHPAGRLLASGATGAATPAAPG